MLSRTFAAAIVIELAAVTLAAPSAFAAHVPRDFGSQLATAQRLLAGARSFQFTQRHYAIGGKALNVFIGPPASNGGYELTVGLNNQLWYGLVDQANSIISLTTKGAGTSYPVPSGGENPIGIAEGADGQHMWFSMGDCCPAMDYGEVTSGGSFNLYDLSGNPGGSWMVLGPDKRIWFALSGKVATVNANAQAQVYKLPNDENPEGLAVGPDNNIWYTAAPYSGNYIGKITTKGKAKDFNLGFSTSGIAAGVDGNMWFASAVTSEIGRISTSFTNLTTFTARISGIPNYITAGPDGNMYFSEWLAADDIGAIARITTAGVVTEFWLPYGFEPEGITVGPDGNIWTLDLNHDQLGQLVLKK